MPRAPQLPWPIVRRILELAVVHGKDNTAVIQRSLAMDLRELRFGKGFAVDYCPDVRTIHRIVNEYINQLSPEAVLEQLPPSVWALRADYKTLKQVAEANKARGQDRSYQETPHKQKMRELAAKLEGEIGVPWILDCLIDQLQPGRFFLGKEMLPVCINKKGRVQVELRVEQRATANAYLYEALCSHLKATPYSEALSGIGGWKTALGGHLETCHRLLSAVRDEVTGLSIPSGNGERPGATKWFSLLICGDAVMQATGYPWITDSWYRYEGLNLRCGSYGIYIGTSDEDLETRTETHKELRARYAKAKQVILIAEQRQALTERANEIALILRKFREQELLTGQCELCS